MFILKTCAIVVLILIVFLLLFIQGVGNNQQDKELEDMEQEEFLKRWRKENNK